MRIAGIFMVLVVCAQGGQTAEPAKVDAEGHQKVVIPFFEQHCLKCHGPTKKLGGLTLHDLGGKLASAEEMDRWRSVAERLTLGEMPPKKEPRPEEVSTKKVLAWIHHELARAEKGDATQITLRKGNRVNHHSLFHGPLGKEVPPPPRLWRMSPEIYEALTREVAKNTQGVAQPFSTDARDVFKDVSNGLVVDEPTAAQLIRNARAIVLSQTQFVEEGGKLKGKFGARKELVALLDEKHPPSREDMARAIRTEFDLILKRAPSEEEMQRFLALMEKNIKDAGQIEGVRATLSAVLLLPEVIFRLELGQGPPDEQGRRMLSPRELAFAIAYALTDRRPDSALLRAAAEGKLATREDVRREIARMLADPKTQKPRILRFFRQYFGYAQAVDVFKDAKENKDHEPRILVSDTDQLIEYILEQDRDVLRELLTTNQSYVNYGFDRKKGVKKAHEKKLVESAYNVSNWTPKQPMTLPGEQRAGILTQPSWLVAYSANTENHAILRGKWVRERLLGDVVPDLPITVDAQLPEDPKRTLRQRMEVTQQEYCWQCHQGMNPLGLSFEMFDHFGRFRTMELEKPVDASGLIENSGDSKLDGKVENAVDMLKKLADSDHVRQVFVRHAFRYWMGREETLADARTLREADRAYVESKGSMKALITALLTSDTFLYRSVPGAARPMPSSSAYPRRE